MSEAHFTAQTSDRVLAQLMEAVLGRGIVDISHWPGHLPPEPHRDIDEGNAIGARIGGWARVSRD